MSVGSVVAGRWGGSVMSVISSSSVPSLHVNFIRSPGPQSGKTTLLLTIAKGVIADGKSVLFLCPSQDAARWLHRCRLSPDLSDVAVGWSSRPKFPEWVGSYPADVILVDDVSRHPGGMEVVEVISRARLAHGNAVSIVVAGLENVESPHPDCDQCDGTGYVSVSGHAGGRCSCVVVGKPVRKRHETY